MGKLKRNLEICEEIVKNYGCVYVAGVGCLTCPLEDGELPAVCMYNSVEKAKKFINQNKKTMKKSDLKTGMLVESSQGELGIVLIREDEAIIAGNGDRNKSFWIPIKCLKDDLSEIKNIYSINEANASACEFSKNNRELLWSRPSTEKENLLQKANELIEKAEELKKQAENM